MEASSEEGKGQRRLTPLLVQDCNCLAIKLGPKQKSLPLALSTMCRGEHLQKVIYYQKRQNSLNFPEVLFLIRKGYALSVYAYGSWQLSPALPVRHFFWKYAEHNFLSPAD